MRRLLLILTAIGWSAMAQTKVDLGTQSKNVDFTAASETKPVKTGNALPATCAQGDMYFLLSAPPGANVYACVATNTWALQSGGAGGSVTHTGGSLVSAALTTGNGGADVETPNASATMDSSGDIATPGTIAAGLGSGLAGTTDYMQGVAPTVGLNAITVHAPTSVTPYRLIWPASSSTGFLHGTNAANVNTLSFAAPTGTGSAVATAPSAGSSGHCAQWTAAGDIGDSGAACGSGSGAVVPSIWTAWASRPACTASSNGQLALIADSVGLTSMCDGTSWHDMYLGIPITRPPVAASFTTVNGGALSDSAGTVVYTKNAAGLGANLIPLPAGSGSGQASGTWTVTAALQIFEWSNFHECGAVVANGTVAGSSVAKTLSVVSSESQSPQYQERIYNPVNGTLAGGGAFSPSAITAQPIYWLRISRTNAANNTLTYSIGDGNQWIALGTEDFGSAVSYYGFACDPRSSTTVLARLWDLTVQ